MLLSYKVVLENRVLRLTVNGLDLKKMRELVEKTFNAKIIECVEADDSETYFYEGNLGVVIVTDDGDVRCRATLSEITGHILDKHRFELASVLFSAGV